MDPLQSSNSSFENMSSLGNIQEGKGSSPSAAASGVSPRRQRPDEQKKVTEVADKLVKQFHLIDDDRSLSGGKKFFAKAVKIAEEVRKEGVSADSVMTKIGELEPKFKIDPVGAMARNVKKQLEESSMKKEETPAPTAPTAPTASAATAAAGGVSSTKTAQPVVELTEKDKVKAKILEEVFEGEPRSGWQAGVPSIGEPVTKSNLVKTTSMRQLGMLASIPRSKGENTVGMLLGTGLSPLQFRFAIGFDLDLGKAVFKDISVEVALDWLTKPENKSGI